MVSTWDRRMYPKRAGCGLKAAFSLTPPPSDYKYGVQWNIAGQSGAVGTNGEYSLNNYDQPFQMTAG